MKLFRNLPLQRKLATMTMMVTAVALAMTAAAFVAGYSFAYGRLQQFHPAPPPAVGQPEARLSQYLLVVGCLLILAAATALTLASRLQKLISQPVLDLAKTVALVRQKKDYSLRAAKANGDEMGGLIEGFNEMLAQIQERDATLEQRVAERTQELAQSLSVINAALGSTTDGILVVTPQGKRIFQNRRTVELWKIPGNLEKSDDREQVDFVANKTTDPEGFAARVAEYYAHPEKEGQDEIHLKDGTIMERITSPVVDEEGRNYGRIWTFRDVTQSRRYEAALRESEANYYSLVDQMPAGLFRKDKEGRFTFVNAQFCRSRCMKAEEALGKLPDEIAIARHGTASRDSEAARIYSDGAQHHATIMQTGRPLVVEEKFITPDGQILYHHAVKSPVFGANGAIVGSQGILLDITERKRAEAELAYERDLLRTLLENSMDYIYFKDAASRFLTVSNSQARQYGMASPDQLVGKTDFDFFAQEHAQTSFADEEEIIRTGRPIIGKVERECWKDGRKDNWLLTTKMPLRNKAGEIIGTFGISKDITTIKEAEARLESAHQQLLEISRLAGMAEVATSVLHNVGNVLNSINVSTTLVLDLVKKSRLNQLGRVAALLHEQNGNLSVFFTQDPRGKQLPAYMSKLAEHLASEQAELVAEIQLTRKNIEHIKDIVTMQQNYAKVSGVVEKVKVTDLVEDALRMNAGALTRHGVRIVREYPPQPVECSVERQKVLQILINLIRNAKYACDDSARPDKCLTMRVRGEGGRAQIIVADNGVGIPAENMTRIFSHGFTTRQAGHGFGLHSGALAAKELGGSLAAHSDGPGAGASFTLDLPLQPPEKP